MTPGQNKPAVEAFISAGSNIDPSRHIAQALDRLTERVRVKAVSTFYRNPPVGKSGQPPFFNGVFRIATTLPPRELKLDALRSVESLLNRVRTGDKYAPRTIDLDILLYGNTVMDEKDLRIPDPDIRSRPFLAIPLLELAPDLLLPDTGERLDSLQSAKDRSDLTPLPEFTRFLRRKLLSGSDRR
jgi:dihydroneopterin aldolase/2-amino-4-hydroxy-6-hydroxymethyldihydropteridine diphosphokinase